MSKTVNPYIRLIAAALLPAIWSATTTAGIIYVDADAPGPVHDGESWCTAYNYLQDALTDPNLEPGDNIRVADGMYRPDQDSDNPGGTDNRNETFELINDVEIYGGYAGCGAPYPDKRDPNRYETILTGDLNGNDGPDFDNYGDNSYHVVTGSDTDATAVLDGFTITSGNASNSVGGGMYNYPNSSPTINDCRFENNLALNHGGGMFNRGASNPTITDTLFINNSAAAKNGGGIYNHSSNPRFSDCLFSGNSAQLYGGAMCNVNNSEPNIVNCRFSTNFANVNGGAIYNSGNTPDISGCTFTGNLTNGDGGGMYISSSNTEFVNCLFSGNSAGDEGGGIYNWYSNPQLVNSTLSGNSAGVGGGMYNNGSNPELINCIISANRSIKGGGMLNSNSSPTTTNCTFSANSAVNGNAIGCDSDQQNYPSDVQIANCILWDGIGSIWNNDGSSIMITYSDVEGGWSDTGNIDADPMFVRDPNNGGDGWGDDPCTPGINEGANDDFGDLHLLPGSPCIDAADNTMVPADTHDLDDDGDTTELTPLDLDYNPRFIDDPTTANTGIPDPSHDPNVIVDMGPYEFAPQGVAGDIDGDGDVDLVDFAIVSYQWLDVPGDPSADIAPPGGDGEVNSDDLLVVAANWLTGTEVPAGEIIINLSMDELWMYQNLGGSTNSDLTANASIIDDPAGNSTYTYIWEFVLPGDITIEPTTLSGGRAADASWNFAAPNVNQPEGLSDSGQALTVRVTVTGDQHGNTGTAEAQFGIALLADVNNETNVGLAE